MKVFQWFKNSFKRKPKPTLNLVIDTNNKTAEEAISQFTKPLDLKSELNIKQIREFSVRYFWKEIDFQPKNCMISFSKGRMRLNVYYTTLTVASCLSHPTKGKTQLFRKCLKLEEVEKIFVNPRVHTNKGYYTKFTK